MGGKTAQEGGGSGWKVSETREAVEEIWGRGVAGEEKRYETANRMTASEKLGEVKIYLILFLQDNSLAVWWQMTFCVSQKTKCSTGSPVLFHDFSDPGSDKVKVKRERETSKLATDRLAAWKINKVSSWGVRANVCMRLAGTSVLVWVRSEQRRPW